MVNQHGTSTSEVEECDDIAMNPNPAGESLIVKPSEPVFSSESNYKELVNEYVQDTSEELPKDVNLNQSDETLIQSKAVVDFNPFDISHARLQFTAHMSIVRLCGSIDPQSFCSNS